MQSSERKVFVAAKHNEPIEGRRNKLAPMVYGYFDFGGPSVKAGYGCGLEKSTEAMLAHGLLRCVHDISVDSDDVTVTVIVRNDGTKAYLLAFAAKWARDTSRRDLALKKDNLSTWLELRLVGHLASLKMRTPGEFDENQHLLKAEALAKAATDLADRRRQNLPDDAYVGGVFLTDAAENVPSPHMLMARYEQR